MGKALEQLAYDAYEDQCTPLNPRLPLVPDMMAMMRAAYQGYGKAPEPIKNK